MKPLIIRLPLWVGTDKPWLVITAHSCGSFSSWEAALTHAMHIA